MCFYIKRANLLVEAHAIIFFLKLQKTMTSYAYFDRHLYYCTFYESVFVLYGFFVNSISIVFSICESY